jgi:NitT/TauT family transport system ATP-binding protein
MIELRNVGKVYYHAGHGRGREEVTALRDISLSIEGGALVSLVGPTGCGKSTLLEILAGLQSPTSGEVLIHGRSTGERTGARSGHLLPRFLPASANSLFRNNPRNDIAMIFQDYAVFPWMTARSNVLFTLKLAGVPRNEREELARHYLAMVNMEGAEHTYPSRMSGGMRQRLALARALAVKPKIMLMDEPFAAVDALTRERLREDLLDIWEKSKTTIVLVTHDVDEAVFLSDRIYVLSSAPGTVQGTVEVEVPRPRRVNRAELGRIREQVLLMLRTTLNNGSERRVACFDSPFTRERRSAW